MAQCMRVVQSDIVGESGSFSKQCPGPGEFHPVIEFYGDVEAKFVSPIVVCQDHRDPDPKSFVTDEMWDAFMSEFDKHGVRPDRNKTRLAYVGVEDQLAQHLRAAMHQANQKLDVSGA